MTDNSLKRKTKKVSTIYRYVNASPTEFGNDSGQVFVVENGAEIKVTNNEGLYLTVDIVNGSDSSSTRIYKTEFNQALDSGAIVVAGSVKSEFEEEI